MTERAVPGFRRNYEGSMEIKAKTVVHVEHLRNQIYSLIREDLLIGALPSGKRLPELTLALRYQVSRTPVREALAQLHRDGFVTFGSQGYVAASFSSREIAQLVEVKKLMMPSFAQNVLRHATSMQIDQLCKVVAEAKACLQRDVATQDLLVCLLQFGDFLRAICTNNLLAHSLFLCDTRLGMAFATVHLDARVQQAAGDSLEAVLQSLLRKDAKVLAAACLAQTDFYQQVIDQAAVPASLAA